MIQDSRRNPHINNMSNQKNKERELKPKAVIFFFKPYRKLFSSTLENYHKLNMEYLKLWSFNQHKKTNWLEKKRSSPAKTISSTFTLSWIYPCSWKTKSCITETHLDGQGLKKMVGLGQTKCDLYMMTNTFLIEENSTQETKAYEEIKTLEGKEKI